MCDVQAHTSMLMLMSLGLAGSRARCKLVVHSLALLLPRSAVSSEGQITSPDLATCCRPGATVEWGGVDPCMRHGARAWTCSRLQQVHLAGASNLPASCTVKQTAWNLNAHRPRLAICVYLSACAFTMPWAVPRSADANARAPAATPAHESQPAWSTHRLCGMQYTYYWIGRVQPRPARTHRLRAVGPCRHTELCGPS